MTDTPKTDAQQLREAKALIADPARWTQGALARSKYQRVIGPTAPGAVCWCAVGAVIRVSDNHESPLLRWLDLAARDMSCAFIEGVNDRLGHAAAMAMYDRAIALAEKEEQAN